MADLYTISNWATSTTYTKNSIVFQNNYYYYAKEDHVSSVFATDLANGKWGGVLTYGGETKPYFEWRPSYNYSLDIKPIVKTIKFGDGYASDIAGGINNILLSLTLDFNDRDLMEYSAILHFLNAREGSQRFYFIPPAPFNVIKLFVCQSWSPTQSFYDNYNVRCLFEERVK